MTLQESQLKNLNRYFLEMFQRQRAIGFWKNGELKALMSFFILGDEIEADLYHKRALWATPLDNPEGVVIYIDKVISEDWQRSFFRTAEEVVSKTFPQVERAVWFRPDKRGGRDRKMNYTLKKASHANINS